MHFGIGDVQKAPTATRFKPILTFFTIFLGWRVAAGVFFCKKKHFIGQGPFFQTRGGSFLGQKSDQKNVLDGLYVPFGAFFSSVFVSRACVSSRKDFSYVKKFYFGEKITNRVCFKAHT